MENVMIKNAQGEQININVIRYFKLNGLEYLVFSLNEVDDGGYVKLYIAKISNNIANTITDDVEWNLIKDTIKNIIKSNKDNSPLHIVDLDTNKLAQIQLFDQKVFKISDSFLQLLSANKKIEASADNNTNNALETPVEANEITAIEVPSINEVAEFGSVPVNEIEPLKEVASTEFVDNTSADNTDDFRPMQDLNYQENTFQPDQPIVSDSVVSDNLVENSDYALDYKTLYENELNKNQMLMEENQKYKNKIDSLKNIINETF